MKTMLMLLRAIHYRGSACCFVQVRVIAWKQAWWLNRRSGNLEEVKLLDNQPTWQSAASPISKRTASFLTKQLWNYMWCVSVCVCLLAYVNVSVWISVHVCFLCLCERVFARMLTCLCEPCARVCLCVCVTVDCRCPLMCYCVGAGDFHNLGSALQCIRNEMIKQGWIQSAVSITHWPDAARFRRHPPATLPTAAICLHNRAASKAKLF